jgi:glucosamine-6-phosphate deaminase
MHSPRTTIASTEQLGELAAARGAEILTQAIAARGEANVVFATGASQFDVLENLVRHDGIDWSRVTGFHLDEYIGLPASHPASFRRYLKERIVGRVRLGDFHYVDGEAEPRTECQRLGELIRRHPIDVAFVGIGENGHLAFNDPPADFETDDPFIVVTLDEACREQQVGEGWFRELQDVPERAISMSICQILAARSIVCAVPEARKAKAVLAALHGPIVPDLPASILRRHFDVSLYLDEESASQLPAR